MDAGGRTTHRALAENEVKPNKFEISIIALVFCVTELNMTLTFNTCAIAKGLMLGFTSFYPTYENMLLRY